MQEALFWFKMVQLQRSSKHFVAVVILHSVAPEPVIAAYHSLWRFPSTRLILAAIKVECSSPAVQQYVNKIVQLVSRVVLMLLWDAC